MATSLTYSRVARIVAGNARTHVLDITADSSYTAGGYTLAAADYTAMMQPGRTITDMVSFDAETNVGGTTLSLDRTNQKLKFYLGSTETTTTISSKTVRVNLTFGPTNAS